jgi:hypothetical protein
MCTALTNSDAADFGTDLFDPLNTQKFSRGLAFQLFNTFSLSDRARNHTYQFDVTPGGVLEGFRATGSIGKFAWNGDLQALGNVSGTTVTVSDGSNVVYRCTSAGAVLPAGALTTSPGTCGTSVDTGLRVP